MARISLTIDEAINRFSRLKRAVKYTRFLFSTKLRNCSLPWCELMFPPRPHKTSLGLGVSIRSPLLVATTASPFPTLFSSEDDI